MADQFLLTPFFLDQPLGGLDDLAREGWMTIRPELPEGEVQARMAAIYEPLATAVATAVRAGRRPVSLAGDCCAALGMIAGLQRAGLDPTLIWFDAHGDFNTWETTPSGFLGGMPLAMMVGRGDQTIPRALGEQPLAERKVILTDARDLDPLEAKAVAASAVRRMPLVSDLKRTLLPWGPLWVHFDVDVIDPADAPAVSYPARGGPSLRMLSEVFQTLAASRQVSAVSVSLWNPALDGDGATRNTALKLLQLLLA